MNVHLTSHGQGLPLVFFHGWGFDSQVWKLLISVLERDYQLILVDLPGFGLSDCMEWSCFKSALLLKLPPRFALVGWSLGGLYAMRLAVEAPQRVSALLSVASSPCFIGNGTWPGISRQVFASFHANLSTDPEATLRNFVRLQANTPVNNAAFSASPSYHALSMGLTVLDTWDLREPLKNLKLPTSFFFGRLDSITPMATMLAMQKYYPDFHYVLFNKSAHMPFISHTDEFVRQLKGCIQ